MVCLGIAQRVLAAIALAVRLEEWWAARPLALQPIGTSYVYASWLRHALTWAYRANTMPTFDSGNQRPGALIALARETVDSVPGLHVDLANLDPAPALGDAPARDDKVTDSICQADLLWCLLAQLNGQGQSEFYPSFSALYEWRVVPIITRVAQDPNARGELFPGASIDDVKAALTTVLDTAAREGFRFAYDPPDLSQLIWRE